MPEWLDSETFKWIANNGFAVVIAILILTIIVAPILALLRYVIFDAVRYFTNRLDDIATQQREQFRDMAAAQGEAFGRLALAQERQNDSIDRQTEQITMSREQAVRNNEALSALLMFVSHTQQEVVAHRVESRQAFGLDTGEAPTTPGVGVPAGIGGTGVIKPVDPTASVGADDGEEHG